VLGKLITFEGADKMPAILGLNPEAKTRVGRDRGASA